MAKGGSSGRHGGGHKDRDRSSDTGRKQAERDKQEKIARDRGQTDTSGRKGKPSGK